MAHGVTIVREFPRLAFGGAHLQDPERDWHGDLSRRALTGLGAGHRRVGADGAADGGGARAASRRLPSGSNGPVGRRTHYPWRAALATLSVIALLAGPVVALMGHYHVLGTDRTGNDVLYQALKSIRTAFVIGALSTLATLPFALVLGILAGYFKGWVDEVIQYFYTGADLDAQRAADRGLRADGAGLPGQASRSLRDRRRARGSEDLPAVRDPGRHRLGRRCAGWCAARRSSCANCDFVQAATAFGVRDTAHHGRVTSCPTWCTWC